MDKLLAMTRPPTADELANRVPVVTPAAPSTVGLDSRCLTGRVLCISKATRSLTWVVDGRALMRFDVRFGSENHPTREGDFTVYRKNRTWTSTLYGSSMPYSMFFSGGEAVHYSSDFAARGYAGASHGCVNVRDYAGLAPALRRRSRSATASSSADSRPRVTGPAVPARSSSLRRRGPRRSASPARRPRRRS